LKQEENREWKWSRKTDPPWSRKIDPPGSSK
jgi:hypothetical protein